MTLSVIEEACRQVLAEIQDLMAPGHPKMSAKDHTELCGRVRDCLKLLVYKELGCASGKHAGQIGCKGERCDGK